MLAGKHFSSYCSNYVKILHEKLLSHSTLLQNKKNIIITLLQGILFWEKVPLAKVVYSEKANCLLWLMCLREPSACAVQGLALRYEGQFPYFDWSCCQAAACTLLSAGEAAPAQLTSERPFLLVPKSCFFPCCVVCDIEHNFFIYFISSREFAEQLYTSTLGFKALPRKLKQVRKLVVGLEVGKQLKNFTQHLTCISSAPHLGFLCHHYYTPGFFQLKVPEKNVMVLSATFFPVVGEWWLVCNICRVVLACGGIPGCKSQLKLEDRAEGASLMQSQPSCLLELGLTCGLSQTFLKKDLGKFYLAYNKTPPGSMLNIHQTHPNTG